MKEIVMSKYNTSLANTDISLPACIGFALLILTTVGGNTLVLLALYLDKRLHTPSFYLIANMAVADLLLGLSVLPFSSILELLNDRWIFGESLCSTWLALDVVYCTASIIALMAVSVDRYIGVTRPLNYSSIMTTRRTIYLVIIVWAISILTSVVPLFGLTDREKHSTSVNATQETFETCKVNKNTFYTIFSSSISFYIPVIILLILYSRVYQEAKKQGAKLENEKRRLYQCDSQLASDDVRRKQSQTNGSSNDKFNNQRSSKHKRTFSSVSDINKNDVTTTLLNNGNIADRDYNLNRSLNLQDENQFKTDDLDSTNDVTNAMRNQEDSISYSGVSVAHYLTNVRRSLSKRLSITWKRNSQSHTSPFSNYNDGQISRNDELLIVKRKIHYFRREKKAFRTLGVILSALLICWLPFFVTLPLMSILKHYGIITAENTENTWFKITFWLGYFNSALNPFVYAFSNRAIRRAFREVIFRRFCFCGSRCTLCQCLYSSKPNEFDREQSYYYRRDPSNSIPTETFQFSPKRVCSLSLDTSRTTPKSTHNLNTVVFSPTRKSSIEGPVPATDTTDEVNILSNNNKQANKE